MYRVLIFLILAAVLASCASSSKDGFFSSLVSNLDADGKPLPPDGSGVSRRLSGGEGQSFNGVTDPGSGQFVSNRAPYTAETSGGQTQYRLNLVDAPIASAVKNVLGDILAVNYTVDPRVRGSITLQTSEPVGRNTLVDILETTLQANGFGIVKQGGTYNIVPLSEALASTPSVSVPSVASRTPGLKIQVVQLQYISGEEMRTILAPISREGSILRVDNARNYIMIAGNNADLGAMREAIQVFDVDWMKGMSVALHPLKTSSPDAVAKELETIFRAQDGPGTNLIRFVPNERLNSVLVITSRPQYLERAQGWIRQLDRLASTSEQQLFVYPIQNRSAEEMAKVLQSVLSGKSGDPLQGSPSVSPDLTAELVASDPANPTAPGGSSPSSSSAPGVPSVVADVENNALLISTTARNYERIERILRQIDILPTQVMLEAVIAEVTLTDELKFGVRWFFENGGISVGFSDLASGGTGPSFPGLAWSFASSSLEVTLNALSAVTNVKVISSPTLMALNNQEATLQIGDQVPIVTRTATGVEDPDSPIVSTVTLKDTGIILNVTPRVNASGRVLLDIEQEASNVVRTTSSGIDSPTIQQRKVQTRVAVNDGEALIIGGLIQERNSKVKSQVPVLGEIPILGNAFRNKTDVIERTELVIFIRPKVVRNVQEARSVNDEFRRRLDFGASETPGKRIRRDLKRLQ